jgi:hypothetical protein
VENEFGRWEPLELDAALNIFSMLASRWWVTGGHALELFVGRSWRTHDDIDISFCRSSSTQVWAALRTWDLHIAAAGVLRPWTGSSLNAERHENNVWCRVTPQDPWCLDLTISEGDDKRWIFRRDPSLQLPWSDAVLTSDSGVPYLAPELQLLFKSEAPRPKDTIDAKAVLPELNRRQTAFLRHHLAINHLWQELLNHAGEH